MRRRFVRQRSLPCGQPFLLKPWDLHYIGARGCPDKTSLRSAAASLMAVLGFEPLHAKGSGNASDRVFQCQKRHPRTPDDLRRRRVKPIPS